MWISMEDETNKKDGSLDTFFKVMVDTWSILAFAHFRVSYKTNERHWGLSGSHRECPKQKMGDFQRRRQCWCIFQGCWRDSRGCLLIHQGTLWNQENTTWTLNNPSGLSKRPKTANIVIHGWSCKDTAVLTHFFRVMGETHSSLDSSHVRVTYGTSVRQWWL